MMTFKICIFFTEPLPPQPGDGVFAEVFSILMTYQKLIDSQIHFSTV